MASRRRTRRRFLQMKRTKSFSARVPGTATPEDQRRFVGHMLMVMAGQSIDDGLVMQLHAGSLRNHNQSVFERFGPDRGADIPVATEYTRNLRPLLNAFGNDARFRLLLFTLDESTYSRELAPLAGHYPAVRLGPAWWFHDSIEGMTPLPRTRHGNGRHLQHGRLQRRHASVLLDSRSSRSLAPRGRQLARASRRSPHREPRHGSRDGARACLRSRERSVSVITIASCP